MMPQTEVFYLFYMYYKSLRLCNILSDDLQCHLGVIKFLLANICDRASKNGPNGHKLQNVKYLSIHNYGVYIGVLLNYTLGVEITMQWNN